MQRDVPSHSIKGLAHLGTEGRLASVPQTQIKTKSFIHRSMHFTCWYVFVILLLFFSRVDADIVQVMQIRKQAVGGGESLDSPHNQSFNHQSDYEAGKLTWKQHKMLPSLPLKRSPQSASSEASQQSLTPLQMKTCGMQRFRPSQRRAQLLVGTQQSSSSERSWHWAVPSHTCFWSMHFLPLAHWNWPAREGWS